MDLQRPSAPLHHAHTYTRTESRNLAATQHCDKTGGLKDEHAVASELELQALLYLARRHGELGSYAGQAGLHRGVGCLVVEGGGFLRVRLRKREREGGRERVRLK